MRKSTAEVSTMGPGLLDLRINRGLPSLCPKPKKGGAASCTSHPLGNLKTPLPFKRKSCSGCDFYRNQLIQKDKTILELEHKVKAVHEMTTTNNPAAGSGETADKYRMTLMGHQHPPLAMGNSNSPKQYPDSLQPIMPVASLSTNSALPSSTSTGGSSYVNSSPLCQGQPKYFNPVMVYSEFKARRPESEGGDFGVIKVQEIIDKVVERSPGRKGSKEFRAVDNDCFKNLFLRVESVAEETADRKPTADSHASGTSSDETFISSSVGPSWNDSTSKASKKSNVRSKPRNGMKGNIAGVNIDIRPPLPKYVYSNRKRAHADVEPATATSPDETFAPSQVAYQASSNFERMESVEEKNFCDRTTGFRPLNSKSHWRPIDDPKDNNLSGNVVGSNLLTRIPGSPIINIMYN